MVIIYILYIIYYILYIIYYKLKIEMTLAQMKLNSHKECCLYFLIIINL